MTEFRNFLTDFGNLLIVIRANEKLSVEDMAQKIELEKIISRPNWQCSFPHEF